MLLPPVTFLRELHKELNNICSEKVTLLLVLQFFRKFSNFFQSCTEISKHHVQHLADCCTAYIKCIQNYIENNIVDTKEEKLKVMQALTIVGQLPQLQGAREELMALVTLKLFEIVTDSETKLWFGKELLKNYNKAVQFVGSDARNSLAEKHIFYLSKLADLLCSCGDFDYEITIMETIFQMCSEDQIKNYAYSLFPQSQLFQKAVCKIERGHFNRDLREFLNVVNIETRDKVFSIKCDVVMAGQNYRLDGPKDLDGEKLPLWVDFNYGAKTIMILCDPNSLRTVPGSPTSESNEWETIIIEISNVIDVKMSRLQNENMGLSSGVVILLVLTPPFNVVHPSSEEAAKSIYLKLGIFACPEKDKLENYVIPTLFENKFQNLTPLEQASQTSIPEKPKEKISTTYKNCNGPKSPARSRNYSKLDVESSSISDAMSLKNKLLEIHDIPKSKKNRDEFRVQRYPKIKNIHELKQSAKERQIEKISVTVKPELMENRIEEERTKGSLGCARHEEELNTTITTDATSLYFSELSDGEGLDVEEYNEYSKKNSSDGQLSIENSKIVETPQETQPQKNEFRDRSEIETTAVTLKEVSKTSSKGHNLTLQTRSSDILENLDIDINVENHVKENDAIQLSTLNDKNSQKSISVNANAHEIDAYHIMHDQKDLDCVNMKNVDFRKKDKKVKDIIKVKLPMTKFSVAEIQEDDKVSCGSTRNVQQKEVSRKKPKAKEAKKQRTKESKTSKTNQNDVKENEGQKQVEHKKQIFSLQPFVELAEELNTTKTTDATSFYFSQLSDDEGLDVEEYDAYSQRKSSELSIENSEIVETPQEPQPPKNEFQDRGEIETTSATLQEVSKTSSKEGHNLTLQISSTDILENLDIDINVENYSKENDAIQLSTLNDQNSQKSISVNAKAHEIDAYHIMHDQKDVDCINVENVDFRKKDKKVKDIIKVKWPLTKFSVAEIQEDNKVSCGSARNVKQKEVSRKKPKAKEAKKQTIKESKTFKTNQNDQKQQFKFLKLQEKEYVDEKENKEQKQVEQRNQICSLQPLVDQASLTKDNSSKVQEDEMLNSEIDKLRDSLSPIIEHNIREKQKINLMEARQQLECDQNKDEINCEHLSEKAKSPRIESKTIRKNVRKIKRGVKSRFFENKEQSSGNLKELHEEKVSSKNIEQNINKPLFIVKKGKIFDTDEDDSRFNMLDCDNEVRSENLQQLQTESQCLEARNKVLKETCNTNFDKAEIEVDETLKNTSTTVQVNLITVHEDNREDVVLSQSQIKTSETSKVRKKAEMQPMPLKRQSAKENAQNTEKDSYMKPKFRRILKKSNQTTKKTEKEPHTMKKTKKASKKGSKTVKQSKNLFKDKDNCQNDKMQSNEIDIHNGTGRPITENVDFQLSDNYRPTASTQLGQDVQDEVIKDFKELVNSDILEKPNRNGTPAAPVNFVKSVDIAQHNLTSKNSSDDPFSQSQDNNEMQEGKPAASIKPKTVSINPDLPDTEIEFISNSCNEKNLVSHPDGYHQNLVGSEDIFDDSENLEINGPNSAPQKEQTQNVFGSEDLLNEIENGKKITKTVVHDIKENVPLELSYIGQLELKNMQENIATELVTVNSFDKISDIKGMSDLSIDKNKAQNVTQSNKEYDTKKKINILQNVKVMLSKSVVMEARISGNTVEPCKKEITKKNNVCQKKLTKRVAEASQTKYPWLNDPLDEQNSLIIAEYLEEQNKNQDLEMASGTEFHDNSEISVVKEPYANISRPSISSHVHKASDDFNVHKKIKKDKKIAGEEFNKFHLGGLPLEENDKLLGNNKGSLVRNTKRKLDEATNEELTSNIESLHSKIKPTPKKQKSSEYSLDEPLRKNEKPEMEISAVSVASNKLAKKSQPKSRNSTKLVTRKLYNPNAIYEVREDCNQSSVTVNAQDLVSRDFGRAGNRADNLSSIENNERLKDQNMLQKLGFVQKKSEKKQKDFRKPVVVTKVKPVLQQSIGKMQICVNRTNLDPNVFKTPTKCTKKTVEIHTEVNHTDRGDLTKTSSLTYAGNGSQSNSKFDKFLGSICETLEKHALLSYKNWKPSKLHSKLSKTTKYRKSVGTKVRTNIKDKDKSIKTKRCNYKSKQHLFKKAKEVKDHQNNLLDNEVFGIAEMSTLEHEIQKSGLVLNTHKKKKTNGEEDDQKLTRLHKQNQRSDSSPARLLENHVLTEVEVCGKDTDDHYRQGCPRRSTVAKLSNEAIQGSLQTGGTGVAPEIFNCFADFVLRQNMQTYKILLQILSSMENDVEINLRAVLNQLCNDLDTYFKK